MKSIPERDIIIFTLGEEEDGMKYLDLTELIQAIVAETGCSLDAANSYVNTQELYFDKTGVNVDPDAPSLAPPEPAVVNDNEMIAYITENAGMAESFVRRLADAERNYMVKNGFLDEKGEFVPFVKGRTKK